MVNLRQLLNGGMEALRELSPLERSFRVIWLLGPFIMLIERSPADLWLSSLAIAFVIRSIINRDGEWLRVTWVKAFFGFWLVCVVSAAASTHPSYSMGESIVWGRFPIFAAATIFWLGTDKRLIQLMLVSSGIGMLSMAGILFAEFTLYQGIPTRLSWPYGDFNPGNYVAKASIVPLLACFLIGANHQYFKLACGLLVATGTVLFALFLTGERINFILCVCALILISVINPREAKKLCIQAITLMSLVLLFGTLVAPDRLNRFELIASTFTTAVLSSFFEKTPDKQENCLDEKRIKTSGANEVKLASDGFYKLVHTFPPGYTYSYLGPYWYVYKDGNASVQVSTLECQSEGPLILRVVTSSPSPSVLFVGAEIYENPFAKETKVSFAVRSSQAGLFYVEAVSDKKYSLTEKYVISVPNKWQHIEVTFNPELFDAQTSDQKQSFTIQEQVDLRFRLSSFTGMERLTHSIGASWEVADLKIIHESKKVEAKNSHHLDVIRGGLVAFEKSPMLGIGPGVYRILSPELLTGLDNAAANNHPHNFVVQLLAETGVLGAFWGCSLILLIWVEGWRTMRRNPDNKLSKICFVAPLALFWPLSTHGDFFGQWNNIFLWSGVAIALSLCNEGRVTSSQK